MKNSGDQLALMPRQVTYKPRAHPPEYLISKTQLGEFSMEWTAIWLKGIFSVGEWPAAWRGYVDRMFHNPPILGSYDGDVSFCVIVCDAMPWEPGSAKWNFTPIHLPEAVEFDMPIDPGAKMDDLPLVKIHSKFARQDIMGNHSQWLALPDEKSSVVSRE